MLILAFDTSGTAGSAAVLDGGCVLAQMQLDPNRRSARTLAPAFRELLAQAGARPGDVRLVATTVGPGSFTGLRIGVTTAKTFAYAVGAEVLGLSTLEVIAAGVKLELIGTSREVQAVLDAQRGELFVGRFRLSRSSVGDDLPRVERLADDRLITAESWRKELSTDAIAVGSGLRRLVELPIGSAVDEALWEPQAAVLGRLAWRYYQTGRRDDLWKLGPIYLRQSYAEEKTAGTKPGPGGA